MELTNILSFLKHYLNSDFIDQNSIFEIVKFNFKYNTPAKENQKYNLKNKYG